MASTVFKGEIWLTGGRSDLYAMYDLAFSFKNADIWHSVDGRTWVQELRLFGDFFAQNKFVKQPGSIAPWYERFGHTMDAVDIDGDGEEDVMILLGGYSPSPSNDQWLTEDGTTWVYCGLAPWSARGWHSTLVFNNSLHLFGGSPLNNEVWRLESVRRVNREAPLTRAAYLSYTFELNWTRLDGAPWVPRVGHQMVSQWYFDADGGETSADARERILLIGGFGGFLQDTPGYDGGYHAYNDIWESWDGNNWTMLTDSPAFDQRAWHTVTVLHTKNNPKIDWSAQRPDRPPRMYVFGGGSIGFSGESSRRVTVMQGKIDAFYSEDGIAWTKISYNEGGGSTTVTQYSSQEWAKGSINSNTVYIGLWGHNVVQFSPEGEDSNHLFMFGGHETDGGSMLNSVFMSVGGLICDIHGIACSDNGVCGEGNQGCVCNLHFSGEYCEVSDR